jgi:hypothetical protein
MFKEELNQQQLRDRNLFIKKLISAGWDPKGWDELFEGGACLTPEAQAEYQNTTFDLRLSYYAGQGYMLVECVGRDDPTRLSLLFYPNQNFEILVDKVIAMQDTLSPSNYPDFITMMIPLCKLILLETPEGPVKIS